MRIGIDISQIVYSGTGVANYTRSLVENLLRIDKKNTYVLFFSSLRRKFPISNFQFLNKFQMPASRDSFGIPNSKFQIKTFRIPPTMLDILWNKLHIFPIEWFIGQVDVFLSSDWTQPPTIKAKKVTTIHDLTPWKFPKSTHPKIASVHKRRVKWVKKECDLIICDSEVTKKDLVEIIGVSREKVKVVYLGV